MKKKNVKYGAISLALTAFVIIAVLLLNLVVTMLSDRFVLRYDMTSDKLYELSNATTELLAGLNSDIRIHVLMSETDVENNTMMSQIKEVLSRYTSASGGKVAVDFVDVYKNPSYISKYSSGDTTPAEGDLVVESDDRFKVVPFVELFQISTTQSGDINVEGLAAEQSLTTALSYVLGDSLPKAVLLTGHNEQIPESFYSLLEEQNYIIEDVNMALGEEIPEDADFVVLCTPQTDFTADELDVLDRYLRNLGNMIVFYGQSVPALPELERFFEEWGVRVEQTMVFDPDRSNSKNPEQIYPLLTDAEINSAFLQTTNTPPIAIYCRSLTLLDGKASNVYSALVTSDNGYAISYAGLADGGSVEDAEVSSGAQTLAALVETVEYSGADKSYGRLLIFGTDYFSNSAYLSTANVLNRRYLINSFDYVSGESNTLVIAPKTYYSEKMILLGASEKIVFGVLVVLIPLVLLGLGFYQWRKRRHL